MPSIINNQQDNADTYFAAQFYNMQDAGILMPYPSGIIEVNRNVQSGYPWSSNLVMRHSELSDSSTWCEYQPA